MLSQPWGQFSRQILDLTKITVIISDCRSQTEQNVQLLHYTEAGEP